MKLIPWDAEVLFRGEATIGVFPTIAPQIKDFDVYYRIPPVVGFHVIGAPITPLLGFYVESTDCLPPINFAAMDCPCPPIIGFVVTNEMECC